ncbi:MAG: DUF6703 family protein [Actinomycetales bacterium]
MTAAGRPRGDDQAPSSGLRRSVERASRPALIRLSRLSPLVPFALMLVLIVAGLFVPGVAGFVLLMLALLFVGWLLYLGWPAFSASERLMRFAVIVLVAAVAVTKVVPH